MTTLEGGNQTNKITAYMPNLTVDPLSVATTKRKSKDRENNDIPSPSQHSPNHKTQKANTSEPEDVSMDSQSAGSPNEEVPAALQAAKSPTLPPDPITVSPQGPC